VHILDLEILRPLWASGAAGSMNDQIWKDFHAKYRTWDIISLSRVGFNHRHDLALVEMGVGGIGHYYLLKKQNGRWLVTKKRVSWIS
jgi:hypothetical protein